MITYNLSWEYCLITSSCFCFLSGLVVLFFLSPYPEDYGIEFKNPVSEIQPAGGEANQDLNKSELLNKSFNDVEA